MAYFPEGWFESEHRNVNTGTLWGDWPGSGYSPGTTVVDGSVVLAKPNYDVLDNFETSDSLSYDLNSTSQQNVSLSYDWAFKGDLSLLLEHDTDDFDILRFEHYSATVANNTPLTSVINPDWSSLGGTILPFQFGYDGGGLYALGISYDSANDEFNFRRLYNYLGDDDLENNDVVKAESGSLVDDFLSDPVVIHAFYDGADLQMRAAALSNLTDPVHLSGTFDEYDVRWTYGGGDAGSAQEPSTDDIMFGGVNVGGADMYTDHLLEGVSA